MSMNQPATFIAKIELTLAPKLKRDLEDQGFEFSHPPYTIFQAKKKGVICTFYESGKFMVQGKEKHDFITYYLEPEILGKLTYSYPEIESETEINTAPHIGVDEAGKGDVFGPLCVAALYADSDQISSLVKMGIRDSKRLTDSSIIKLAYKIKQDFAHSIVQIFPKRYNELYQGFQNLNTLLGWGHATAIEEVLGKTSCTDVLIDKFANESVVLAALKRKNLTVNLTQRHRGEEDIVVAGASILARAAFVLGIDKLSDEYKLTLPKGASPQVIRAGQKFVSSHGKEALNMVAKLHFKTINQILC